MDFTYHTLFHRNYGIFTEKEQERIRETRVLIIGDSGVGETISIILARSGVERLVIAGKDQYTPEDTNRQIGCFSDTLGQKKTEKIKNAIHSINPGADVAAYNMLPSETRAEELIQKADIIIPASDDFAYSIFLFRIARRHQRAAVLCLPFGLLGWVSVFDGKGPSIEDVFGLPKLDYEDMRRLIHSREYRCAQYNLITSGKWQVHWFWEYFKGKRPLAIICPTAWMLASLAAFEILKLASAKWEPKRAPQCWCAAKGRISASRFSRWLKYHRKFGWMFFVSGFGRRFHTGVLWFWRRFFGYLRRRQTNASQGPGRRGL